MSKETTTEKRERQLAEKIENVNADGLAAVLLRSTNADEYKIMIQMVSEAKTVKDIAQIAAMGLLSALADYKTINFLGPETLRWNDNGRGPNQPNPANATIPASDAARVNRVAAIMELLGN
jgi:hypothetical protein